MTEWYIKGADGVERPINERRSLRGARPSFRFPALKPEAGLALYHLAFPWAKLRHAELRSEARSDARAAPRGYVAMVRDFLTDMVPSVRDLECYFLWSRADWQGPRNRTPRKRMGTTQENGVVRSTTGWPHEHFGPPSRISVMRERRRLGLTVGDMNRLILDVFHSKVEGMGTRGNTIRAWLAATSPRPPVMLFCVAGRFAILVGGAERGEQSPEPPEPFLTSLVLNTVLNTGSK